MDADSRTYIFEGHLRAVAPLATCSKDLADTRGGKNKPVPVPSITTPQGQRLMFPATGFRGALRRRGRDILRQAAIDSTGNSTPFSLDQHYFLTLGGVKDAGDQPRSTVAMEDHWRRKNPLLNLFGAGDAGVLGFVQGRLSVGNAIAADPVEPVVFSGARTDDIYRDKSQVRYLSAEDIESLVSRATGNKQRSTADSQIKQLKQQLKERTKAGQGEEAAAIRSQIAELEQAKITIKEETGTAGVSLGMPLSGWQAIPPETKLNQRIIAVRASLVDLGFFLHTLDAFAQEPILGAHFAAGHGVVKGEWTVDVATTEGRRTIGTVAFDSFSRLSLLPMPGDSTLRDAWDAFAGFLSSAEWDFAIPTAV